MRPFGHKLEQAVRELLKNKKVKIKAPLQALKKIFKKDREILFAYLYGSCATGAVHPGSDIDIAVFLKPSDIKDYVKKQEELTTTLVTALHNDNIDLRILNTLPFLLKYKVLKEGVPILIKDESARVEFETATMNRFFQLKPYLEEYNRMLLLRIQAGI